LKVNKRVLCKLNSIFNSLVLTTGPPWQNLQPIAAIFHIATCDKPQYQLPENVSKSAREFIDTCLTKDYHQRPTAENLIHHTFLSDIHNHNHHHHTHEQTSNQTLF
jgi:serine/threonine protein kinase